VGPVRARGGGGVPQKTFPLARRDRGGGCSTPLPVSPSPTGGDSPSIHCRGGMSINHRLGGSIVKILFPTVAQYPGLSPDTRPPPLEGAGGGAERAGRRGWLAYSQEKTFPVICRRQGRGTSRPPPRQPLPHGGRFSIDTLPVNSIPSPGFRREPHRRSCLPPRQPLPHGGRFSIDTLPVNSIPSPGFRREPHRRSCLPPRARYPVNRHALPAPSRGREEAARAAGRRG